MPDNEITTTSIDALLDKHFLIPDYQRGYRWEPQQVKDLLSDIWEFAEKDADKAGEFYCLQPIVLKECSEDFMWDNGLRDSPADNTIWYEVIDGQQRLTTIHILISYYRKYFPDDPCKNFTIRYQTRAKSTSFLNQEIYDNTDKSDIDIYHMSSAYSTIENWFKCEDEKDYEHRPKWKQRYRYFETLFGDESEKKSVRVIWYKVNENIESEILFERLNNGKIPLTNSELIKALFLSSSSFGDDPEKKSHQNEIAKQWEVMEHRLNDQKFWAFITNKPFDTYDTHIEYLFDLLPGEVDNPNDKLATFLKFDSRLKQGNIKIWDLWLEVESCYQTLNYWYEDKNLYHKIGFLIWAKGEQMVKELLWEAGQKNKNEFENELDSKIKAATNFDYTKLAYDKGYIQIQTLLTLHNIETVRRNANDMDFYPFSLHKSKNWTLEHIHAQNTEGFDENKKDPWLSWLKEHATVINDFIEMFPDDKKLCDFSKRIQQLLEAPQKSLTFNIFQALVGDILDYFERLDGNNPGDVHAIPNLALLGGIENTKLQNSAFEVKRRAIINMDIEGEFIPVCTRRVFLKYYTDGTQNYSNQQYYFWSPTDRQSYLKDINKMLSPYLPENTTIE
jgi:uncharacterized protein with ParB-like and HNH nuclease domain